MLLSADACHRAVRARDARFDGIFFVAVTTTGVYCRPICPTRLVNPGRRRFFDSAAAAELAGFRPCLRCRPELAPGRALIDAVPPLAGMAVQRIAAGALNGRSVAQLARELGVSERHLRRVVERAIGVSPIALAETHRLLLAKRLLADTALPMTRIAFGSGFQSLRRFNALFRERYHLTPSAQRSPGRSGRPEDDVVRLTLAYRAPLAWDLLTTLLAGDILPGVEVVQQGRYGRTVRLDGRSGVVFAANAAAPPHLDIDVSSSLFPVLMPLLARLRRLFDLDAEPTVIDSTLAKGGLGALVRRWPGLRIPGTFDGFEAALGALLRGPRRLRVAGGDAISRRVVRALGEPVATGVRALTRLAPTAERVADAGPARLTALGLPRRRALALVAVSRAIVQQRLRLEPGSDIAAVRRALLEIDGVSDRLATTIVARALYWPDAFPTSDPALQLAAGAASAETLHAQAERWRPWRAYAALHLGLHANEPLAHPGVP